MKKYLKLLPIIIFILLIIESFPIESEKLVKGFDYFEEKLEDYNDFIKNGVRMEYITSNKVEDEIKKIKEKIITNFEDINLDKNSIIASNEEETIEAFIWNEEEGTKVQISCINNNKDISTDKIKKKLQQISDFSTKNIKYFNFIKVRIIEEEKQNFLDLLKKNLKEETLEELDIYNGKVSKGELRDGTKINFSLMEYENEEYLVLGTPVIFITY